jgi:queuine/archaeosine tRNA-ribosyltransferase
MTNLINNCAGAEYHVLPAKRVHAMLINVPDNANSKSAVKATWRMFKAAKPQHTMLDSGGFQLLMAEENGKVISFDGGRPVIRNDYEINLAPIHVVEAAALFKPDIFVGLDFPIRKFSEPAEQRLEFMRKVGFNTIWAMECSELRKRVCPGVPFFLPIQCYDLQQLDQFLGMIPNCQYDGFSMPIRNLSVDGIILFLVRFYQLGVRQVHLLGTSKIMVIALAAYMARHFFSLVSFDATTWRKWAEFSWYMNPHTLLDERIAQNVRIDERIAMDCRCPFCKGKTFTYIKNLPETERTNFLRSHNWWVIEQATQDLFGASGSVLGLERCLRARGVAAEDVDRLSNSLSLADALRNCDIGTLQAQLVI